MTGQLVTLEQGIAAVEAADEAAMMAAKDEAERQYYLLSKTMHRPFQEWLHCAVHSVDPLDLLQAVTQVATKQIIDTLALYDLGDDGAEIKAQVLRHVETCLNAEMTVVALSRPMQS